MRIVFAAFLLACLTGCLHRPSADPNVIVVSMAAGPNNLDPRVGADSYSEKVSQLMYSSLVEFDDHLRVTPALAERLEQTDPVTYVVTLRRGVKFHDGHELTADDVVYTFRSFLDPAFVSPKKGGYRELQAVDARDRYTVVFTLKKPFPSFPVNLKQSIVAAGAGPELRDHPNGTGPYRFVNFAVDDHVAVAAFPDYFGGPPKNDGIVVKITPDDIMRGLELQKGTLDLVVNELGPDLVYQLRQDAHLQEIDAPGVDYQYLAFNMRDPILRDVRVRQAIAYAIDRQAIVDHLRRGLAAPADSFLPELSWAHASDVFTFPHDVAKAKALLDAAGYPDPDGDGPQPRFHLSFKTTTVEYYRLQAAVIQQDLQEVGIALDIRSYEFATIFADILAGNFQTYTLQWAQGALADPDILRRVFHSSQTPPAGFNRGFYNNPRVDALLDKATEASGEQARRELYGEAQRVITEDVPYVSLWHIRNVAVAQRALSGITLSPLGDFLFLRNVARVAAAN